MRERIPASFSARPQARAGLLTLNDKKGVIGPRQVKVIVARGFAIEPDLEILVAGLSDRYVVGVDSHWL